MLLVMQLDYNQIVCGCFPSYFTTGFYLVYHVVMWYVLQLNKITNMIKTYTQCIKMVKLDDKQW